MRSAVVLGVGLIGSLFAALFLAHRMVIPIRRCRRVPPGSEQETLGTRLMFAPAMSWNP